MSKQDTSKEALCGFGTNMQGDLIVPCSNRTNWSNYI